MELDQSHTNLLQHTARVARHFAATRGLEVLVLQASPILGSIFGGIRPEGTHVAQMAGLLFGSLALTTHVFVLNDWAGHAHDLRDPRRTAQVFSQRGIGRMLVARIALLLLLLAMIAFAALGLRTLLFGFAIAALSLAYSCSSGFGKRTPILGSINHLIGGALHFLLGYTLFHTTDINGLGLSLFFGLVFAGGHLNQEVRDHAGDQLNGIRTTAVAFGPRPAFLASVTVFTAAYAVLATYAALQTLPGLLLCAVIASLLHIALSLRALHRGLGFETACWLQLRYRILLAWVGITMLAFLP